MEQLSNSAISRETFPENSKCPPQGRVGFKISHLEKEVYHAVRQAYDYVIMARDKGAQIRTWVISARDKVDFLVNWAEDFKVNGLGFRATKEEIEEKLNELGRQESKILGVVHKYLKETTEIKNKFALLNPPLNSNQLQPFLMALAEDKKRTVAALENLTFHLEKLTHLKLSIFRDLQNIAGE